ncbi:hypothetical protein [Archangium sp.]|jgi:hypothetical protein|uniref:hypothetical protein n=1 Tax=Archangium sp. TaxID=1872627 RepID=UPI002ED94BA2
MSKPGEAGAQSVETVPKKNKQSQANEFKPYRFEEVAAQRAPGKQQFRPPGEATVQAGIFLSRLGFDTNDQEKLLEGPLGVLLVKHATEYQLNIKWYEQELLAKQNFQKRQTRLIVFVTLLAILATIIASFAQVGWSGQLTLVITAVFAVMRLFAAWTDVKAQIGIFWEAASNLKERLYTFEQAWRGKGTQWIKDSRHTWEFRAALEEQIRLARLEVRKERTAFFQTLKSPSEVLDMAVSLWQGVQRAGQETTQARLHAKTALDTAEARTPATPEVSALEAAYQLAKLRFVQAEQTLERLKNSGQPPEMINAAHEEVLAAESSMSEANHALATRLIRGGSLK